MAAADTSPFLRLPAEIRLAIYPHLFVVPPRPKNGRHIWHRHRWRYTDSDAELIRSAMDSTGRPSRLLHFRNAPIRPRMVLRRRYKVRSGRLRSACEDASYKCMNKYLTYTAIMRVNQQIHAEAAECLYGSYVFDFDTDVEACVPFLMDLTPVARRCIQSVSVVKRALPYDKEFDRCEWTNMCKYLASSLHLEDLVLGVIAGKPATGWECFTPFESDDFVNVIHGNYEMDWVSYYEALAQIFLSTCFSNNMSQVNDLATIKGLQRIYVRACVEHSPPAMSDAMEFFIKFSASIEPHFAEYLKSRMLGKGSIVHGGTLAPESQTVWNRRERTSKGFIDIDTKRDDST